MSNTLMSNGYPKQFLQRIESNRVMRHNRTPPPEELVHMFFNVVEPKSNCNYAVLFYIKGLTEPLKRLLKSYDIRTTKNLSAHLNKCFPPSKTDHRQKIRQTLYTR